MPDKTKLGGKGDPSGIVPEIKIWPCKQIVYAQIPAGRTY